MRSRLLRILAVSAALVPAGAALPATSAQASRAACASSSTHPAQAASRRVQLTTLCLINRERSRHGLRALRLDSRLSAASLGHSRNMVSRGYFEHGNFVARIMNAHYVRPGSAWSLAENIAWGTGYLATPAQIVRGWMNSSGHRANILNGRFRDIGVGIALGAPTRGASGGATYTTDFGRKG
jgi:uncharacterized protein YkwD